MLDRALIVCPAFLKSNWGSEINKFVDSPNIDITSYSRLKSFKADKYAVIIFDEAHYLKNPSSQRSKKALELVQIIDPDSLLLLTGTPIKNRVPDIWHLLKLCSLSGEYDLGNYTSHNKFCHGFCYETPFFANGYTFRRFEGLKSHMADTLRSIIKPVYYRKRLVDVEIDLPEQTYKYIHVGNMGKGSPCHTERTFVIGHKSKFS